MNFINFKLKHLKINIKILKFLFYFFHVVKDNENFNIFNHQRNDESYQFFNLYKYY